MILHSSELLLMINLTNFIKKKCSYSNLQSDMEEAVYCSIVYNSKNLETMEMPIISINTGHIFIEPYRELLFIHLL